MAFADGTESLLMIEWKFYRILNLKIPQFDFENVWFLKIDKYGHNDQVAVILKASKTSFFVV